MTLDDLADQWLRLCNRTGIIALILSEPMFTRVLQSFGIASILGAGVVLAASPAKAITYAFSGTSSFTCNTSTSQTCDLAFDGFTADWDGSNWSMSTPTSLLDSITITNQTSSDTFSLIERFTTISAGNSNFVAFANSSDPTQIIAFTFTAPASSSPTAPSLLTLDEIEISGAGTQFNTLGTATLGAGPQAYAAPYFASVLSVIPMLAASKRIKRRVLSA